MCDSKRYLSAFYTGETHHEGHSKFGILAMVLAISLHSPYTRRIGMHAGYISEVRSEPGEGKCSSKGVVLQALEVITKWYPVLRLI